MANVQTYDVSIPSVALARMAMGLAGYPTGTRRPPPRAWVDCPICYPRAVRYYRIIDRIARGEKP